MDLKLEGKIAMVAAASRGLGLGIARELAREGAVVSIASRDAVAIEKTAEELRTTLGARVLACAMDAGVEAAINDWFRRTIAEFGGVDILVTNAGGPPAGFFDNFDDADWQSAYTINLLGTIRMIRNALPSMRQRGGGSILAVTSCSVKEPMDRLILSNVMRSGVTSLVKTLSLQLAPDGIRVNNIMPGRIDTDRIRSLDAMRAEQTGTAEELCRAEEMLKIPLRRYGTTEEFGRAAAFLLSDAASYITGTSLALDGGALKTVW
jgi:3-oxoacyl-[acyl-carrier protein] reductase